MNQSDTQPAALTFEQALAELERIVAQLERGDVALEDSIALYQRGAELRAHCDARLREAQIKVDQIVAGPDGVTVESARLG